MPSNARDVDQRDPRVIRTHNDVAAAAVRILINEGWDAVTPARVAADAGYSRATIYARWPNRTDLIRDAFARYGDMLHHDASGEIAHDLRGELASFCRAMVDQRLDRALAMLAERSQTTPEIAPMRDAFVAEGERPMRLTLEVVADPHAREAAVLMLCGIVTHSMLMHGTAPSDEVLDAGVAIVIRGLAQHD